MHTLVVGRNNTVADDLELAERIVDDVVVFATDFFRCAVVTRAHNMLRNGKEESAVRAELSKVNGWADWGYDEP